MAQRLRNLEQPAWKVLGVKGAGPKEDWKLCVCVEWSGIEMWIARPLMAETGVLVWLNSALNPWVSASTK